MSYQIQLRSDTAANWTTKNSVLAKGEPGFETDTGRLKVGDGATAWNVLAYFVPDSGIVPPAPPTGSITMFAGSSAPSGWLICDGTELSRETYSSLFSIVGTIYGSGNNTTTFNLPNLKGKVPAGFDVSQTEFNSLGQNGGAKTHTLTTNEMPSHTHTQNAHSHSGSADTTGSHSHTGTTDGGGAHDHGNIASSGSHDHSYVYGNTVARATGTTSGLQGTVRGQSDTTGTRSHTHDIPGSGTHTHTFTTGSDGSHSHSLSVNDTTATNQNTGGGAAHNILQPYLTLNYIIKV